MDIYLPDEFYALSESPNSRRDGAASQWLGAEAMVSPLPETATNLRRKSRRSEPDPTWCVV